MTLTVDNPILNFPYREPERYWLYDAAGMPRVEYGRRPAGYYFRARARASERHLSMLADEQFKRPFQISSCTLSLWPTHSMVMILPTLVKAHRLSHYPEGRGAAYAAIWEVWRIYRSSESDD